MSDERDVSNSIVPVESFSSSLPVTRDMLSSLTEQRKLLQEFVSSQLRKEVDYGIIPGTKKSSLFKPGGEKIARLFGLRIENDCTNQTVDRNGNFAMFTYKSRLYRGDIMLAECEGSANSQEKKYRERTVYIWDEKAKKKVPHTEATPIFDVLNTLQKMAQKRAFVGAVILAVGASDFFTQDIDDPEDAKTLGVIPTVAPSPSAIPEVKNVSSEPAENRQSGGPITVEAIAHYDDRQMVKDAGFRWNSGMKKWLKEISPSEMNSFPFEVKAV